MGDAYPTGPRILAGAGALVILGFFGLLLPARNLATGYPLAAATGVITALPLVLFLGGIALAPDTTQRLLARHTRIDLRDRGHVGAAVLMAGTLYLVIGLSLTDGVYAHEAVYVHGETDILTNVSADALFFGLLVNLLILTAPVLVYVAVVGRHGFPGALRALGLRAEDAGRGLTTGFGIAMAFLLGLFLLGLLITRLPIDMPENERALAIAGSLTLLGALGVAIVTGLSEEVFFRGFLQPRIGLWGQAVVFGLAHLNYVDVMEVLVTFALALAFGLVYRRTGNLWAPIGAHFLFNLIQLIIGIYAPEAAPTGP